MFIMTVKNQQSLRFRKDCYILIVAWSKDLNITQCRINKITDNDSLRVASFWLPEPPNESPWMSYDDVGKPISIINDSALVVDDYNGSFRFFLKAERELKLAIYEHFLDDKEQLLTHGSLRVGIEFVDDGSLPAPHLYMPKFSDYTGDTTDVRFCIAPAIHNENCALDLETGKPLNSCMNWRRIDSIGTECVNSLSLAQMNNSISQFCRNPSTTNSDDCKCENRTKDPRYLKESEKYPQAHDYCWYQNCKSGNYLVRDMGQPVNCNGVYCTVIYNVKDVNGNLVFEGNKVSQDCKSLTSLPQPPVDPELPPVTPPPAKPPTSTPEQRPRPPLTEDNPFQDADQFTRVTLLLVAGILTYKYLTKKK